MKDTSKFIDLMYTSSFHPTFNTPTCVSATSKTLINNIFYNCRIKDVISGNVTTSFSDHLTQFLIVSNKQSNKVTEKQTEIRTFNM